MGGVGGGCVRLDQGYLSLKLGIGWFAWAELGNRLLNWFMYFTFFKIVFLYA